MPPKPTVITAHVCGGRAAKVCPVTYQEHRMTKWVDFKDGGSISCEDCGATAMDIDLMKAP